MPYTIVNSHGDTITTVADSTINQITDLTFIGKGYVGYGGLVDTNFFKLLENFSNESAPSKPVQGELWWDRFNKQMNVYDGTQWVTITKNPNNLTVNSTVTVGTTLTAAGLQITTNQLASTATNGNINITPNGTGATLISRPSIAGSYPAAVAYVNGSGTGVLQTHSAFTFNDTSLTISVPNMSVTYSMNAANVGGVLTTNAQPYVNSLGTLTGLVVNGPISATSTGGVITAANNFVGLIGTNSQPYITSHGTLTSLAVSGAANLTTLAANTISATVVGNSNTATTFIGTIRTNAQPYINSTGALQAPSVTTVSGGQLTGYHTGAIGANGANTGSFTTVVTNGQTTAGGDIIPSANLTYSLGSSSNRFSNLYLGGQSLYLGNVSLRDTGGNLNVLDATGVNPVNMVAASINSTIIGNAVAANATVTNLIATGQSNIQTLSATTISAGTIGNSSTNLIGTLLTANQPYVTAVGTLINANVSGNLFANTLTANSITTLNGGQVTGYHTGPVGANAANTGAFTSVVTVNGGQLTGYHTGPIGANLANTGAFTNVSAINITLTGNISAMGNIAANSYTGTWIGNAITPNYGGTGLASAPVLGQILIGNGAGQFNLGNLLPGVGMQIDTTTTPGSIYLGIAGGGSGFNGGIISNALTIANGFSNALTISNGGNANITGGIIANTAVFGNNLSQAVNQITMFSWGPANVYSTLYTSNLSMYGTGNAQIAGSLFVTRNLTGGNVYGNITGNLQSANAVLTGGYIDATVIGATTPAVGTFSNLYVANLRANTSATFVGNITAGNINANAFYGNLISSSVTITGGTINGTALGTSVAATANVTSLQTNGTLTPGGHIIPNTSNAWNLGTNNTFFANAYVGNIFGLVSANNQPYINTVSTVTASGSLNGPIGNATANTAIFTSVNVTGNSFMGGNIIPTSNVSYDLGTPTMRWRTLYLAGSTIDLGGASISGSAATGLSVPSLNSTIIGNTTPAAATFTSMVASSEMVTGTSTLTTVTATSVTAGTIGNSGTTLTGTVSTNAQPYVTSVGTLTGLSVSGGIVPSSNASIDIGSASSQYFRNFYGTSTTALYADVAERYVADADYSPGTVLDFGGQAEVTLSRTPNSRRVAGIVSTNPAYLMNGGLLGEHVVSLALLGRVPCRVTGRVRKGDMLTSRGDGTASVTYRPEMGMVIGKAVQDSNDELEKVIEVVVGRL